MTKSVLVVEDDTDMLETYAEILQSNGYTVDTAKDGQEGVSKFKECKPQLVLMDSDMPKMDGFEAFTIMKKIDQNAKIIIITGMSQDKRCDIAMNGGLESIITKPIGLDMILELVRKHVKS